MGKELGIEFVFVELKGSDEMKSLFGSEWNISTQWEFVPIKSLTSDWKGGAPFKPNDFTEEGFPVLHKGAIHRNRHLQNKK